MPAPPFEPSKAALSSQLTNIQDAVVEYNAAVTPAEKQGALSRISKSSLELSLASTSPPQVLQQFTLLPQRNAVVRMAMEMGVFDNLPESGSKTVLELAAQCHCDPEFMQRILRATASIGFLSEVGEDTYSCNPLSKLFLNPLTKAHVRLMLDNVAVTMSQMTSYINTNGFRSPSDSQNTPSVFARGLRGVGYFEWLSRDPAAMKTFNDAMAMHTIVGAKEIVNTYPFGQLQSGHTGVSLVDVGGGKGHILKEIFLAHPSLVGRCILQDLPEVLADGVTTTETEVKCQPYDFLQESQPVKGASGYFFRHVFHDWPDESCLNILRNHIGALKGEDSRLLISDMVLPDLDIDSTKALRDINMMHVAGKERSEKQWHKLLEQAGYRIVHIHGLQNQGNSIIEAVLK